MKKYIIAMAVFIAANAVAGPLGLNKGMTLEELKKQGAFSPVGQQYVYTSKTLASGHTDFDLYTVILTPEQGLCKIQASSKEIDTSSFGTELESKYRRLIDAMSEKYGPPGKNFDFLSAGSLWEEPQYWMMALLKKERTLSAFWSAPVNNNLPDSIQSITIESYALSGSTGYIRLSYEFDNIDACIKVVKSKENSTL